MKCTQNCEEYYREYQRREEVYREALQFYADLENWKWKAKPTDSEHILDCGSEVQRDFSRRAQQALQTGHLCRAGV